MKQHEPQAFPNHIAIIMDGNGRWASRRLLPRTAGHKAGTRTFRDIAQYAEKRGVKHITFYVFSTENWKRPQEEVDALMRLLEEHLRECLDDYRNSNRRAVFLGDRSVLSPEIRALMDEVEEASKEHTGICVNLAINYGGKAELTRAARLLAQRCAEGALNPEDITEQTVADALYTVGQPDVDLLIRTGGDLRISNFLLWQIAYAEIYVTDKLWPDFTEDDLDDAIASFGSRDRRFGGIKTKPEAQK
ncbi:MAG: di-trans,poly-cis-decaprenylcistransferase [Clostridia bacterium]|nr:di-trans,poly-cis-decaprenylcistransferase [Clostridia bacterium]